MNDYPSNAESKTTERLSKETFTNVKRIFDGENVQLVIDEEDDLLSLEIVGTDNGLQAIGYENVEVTAAQVELSDGVGGSAGMLDILTLTASPINGEKVTYVHTSSSENQDGSWTVTRNYDNEYDDDLDSKDDEGREVPITLKGVEELDLIISSALVDAGSIQGRLPEEE